MFFRRKWNRLIDVEKAEQRFEEEMAGGDLEAKDKMAMVIAAFIVFVPALLLVIGIFLLLVWFFFLRYV